MDGTDEPSTRTASRRHRATPLNDASRTWWGFLPLIWRMCRVIPALVANALQNSSASCGSNGGFPNGSGAGGDKALRDGERVGAVDGLLVEIALP